MLSLLVRSLAGQWVLQAVSPACGNLKSARVALLSCAFALSTGMMLQSLVLKTFGCIFVNRRRLHDYSGCSNLRPAVQTQSDSEVLHNRFFPVSDLIIVKWIIMENELFTLQNEQISITVQAKGAELVRLFHKSDETEYLWDGNPAFWGKHSPVLFPIVGALKENTYYYQDKPYQLSRHGFARDKQFVKQPSNASELRFRLESDAETLQHYPFPFRFEIIYGINQNRLTVTYRVVNTGTGSLYFSVGGHPAFKVPVVQETEYDDYYLEFETIENTGRWPISPEGLLETKPEPFFSDTNRLYLKKELFYRDALVFKDLRSEKVVLGSLKHNKTLTLHFPGFPYLGIWAARNAPFICIEPWCGIADSVNSSQQLTQKEGIIMLDPAGTFERSWMVELNNAR